MKTFFDKFYLPLRFFFIGGALSVLFALSFWLEFLYMVSIVLFVMFLVLVLADIVILFIAKKSLQLERKMSKVFYLDDPNKIEIHVINNASFKVNIRIIDEIPVQFQKRDFGISFNLNPRQEHRFTYELRPGQRGIYEFGKVHAFQNSGLGLVTLRESFDLEAKVAVYPSINQMKKYELHANVANLQNNGIKKLRRIGHSYEFEQIKNYVIGDDTRCINWKASSRRGEVMVNHYDDERSQQVYSIVDKSRVMKMPFNGMSLLDYAINTSLVISNVSIQKHDKAGLITFSDTIDTVLPADTGKNQLTKIFNALYAEKEHHYEANYEYLYNAVRHIIPARSLLFLYTNFESVYSLKRILPILRKISKRHLLVVMFFENTELADFAGQKSNNVLEIYQNTVARMLLNEKEAMIEEMRKFGIHAIKSLPGELSVHTVNKYLELKSRGII